MKKIFWFVVGILVIVFLVSFLTTSIQLLKGGQTNDLSSANIAVIEIDGVITESFSVLEDLRELKDNPQLKALVVRLDTPGGAVGASQEIYLELKKLRANMPVVVSMGNVAASGGLYISLGASQIVALPGSITGSMGVLMPITNVSRLMDKIYVDPITIKSGQLKDAGNPLRPMSPQGREYLQDMVDKTFAQFRQDVVTERKLTEEAAKHLSDGRVVDGISAKELGLVDQLGTFEDAVELAKTQAKIEEKAKLAFLSREPEGLVYQLLRGSIQSIADRIFAHNAAPFFLLDWNLGFNGAPQ